MASIEQEMKQSRQAAEDITRIKPVFGNDFKFETKEKKPLVLRDEEPAEVPSENIDKDAIRLRQRYAESAFNDRAESQAGAKGAFQIMPKTAEEYSKKMGEGDLFDPDYNGRMRDAIWNELYNSFTATNGNPPDSVRVAKALAMYNRGRGAVGDWLAEQKKKGVDIYNSSAWVDDMPWKETRDYVNFILFGKDIPNTSKTKAAYEKAKKDKGY